MTHCAYDVWFLCATGYATAVTPPWLRSSGSATCTPTAAGLYLRDTAVDMRMSGDVRRKVGRDARSRAREGSVGPLKLGQSPGGYKSISVYSVLGGNDDQKATAREASCRILEFPPKRSGPGGRSPPAATERGGRADGCLEISHVYTLAGLITPARPEHAVVLQLLRAQPGRANVYIQLACCRYHNTCPRGSEPATWACHPAGKQWHESADVCPHVFVMSKHAPAASYVSTAVHTSAATADCTLHMW